jgi:hypothetical protein
MRQLLIAAVLGAALLQPASAESVSQPVVVELFTSQGCSSCPPADAFLGELAARPDLVALSLHVDYWDYIGWKDPFASPETTERQRAYARTVGRRMVYTPQMVIDGEKDAVGSDRSTVLRLIGAARRDKIPVTLAKNAAGAWEAVLPDWSTSLNEPATVWLAFFDKEHVTPVKRGENAGATISNYNVVRDLRSLGQWDGKAARFLLDVTGRDGCAVIVQEGRTGRVLGAALMTLAADGS